MAARTVIHLVHLNADNRWHLKDGDQVLGSFDTKEEAMDEGKKRGHALQEKGQNAQLVIHRQDGSIETEHTYGDDPTRHPG